MRAPCACSKLRKVENVKRFSRHRDTVVAMITILSALVSLLSFRVRSRASLELELVALRHQVRGFVRRKRSNTSHPNWLTVFYAQGTALFTIGIAIGVLQSQLLWNFHSDRRPALPLVNGLLAVLLSDHRGIQRSRSVSQEHLEALNSRFTGMCRLVLPDRVRPKLCF